MEKGLVSIITPCYNGEKTIARLFDSILNQTYKKIEYIFVNDGSTDRTEEIVENYKDQFATKGIMFKYFYQNNKGLGGAIDTGLKHFTGEFLCWPDADDYLESNSIEERVNVLKANPEYAIVTSDAFVRDYNDLYAYKSFISNGKKHLSEKKQFKNLLDEDGIFCTGCHMVRSNAFLEVNPKRSIYPARRGQNWQMLLPIYYKFDAYFLNKPLYNYIDYPSSMSKNQDCLDSYLLRFNEHREILLNTLDMIEKVQKVDLSNYEIFIEKKYAFLKMHVSLKYFDYKNFDKEFKIKKIYGIEKRDIIALLRRYIKPLNHLYLRLK
ncbi:MAG: glycosyltransferase family 2 protein [Clostridia bacterium]|nr:glycosyltransferase family 2 protein [Clostridia bacterium]